MLFRVGKNAEESDLFRNVSAWWACIFNAGRGPPVVCCSGSLHHNHRDDIDLFPPLINLGPRAPSRGFLNEKWNERTRTGMVFAPVLRLPAHQRDICKSISEQQCIHAEKHVCSIPHAAAGVISSVS